MKRIIALSLSFLNILTISRWAGESRVMRMRATHGAREDRARFKVNKHFVERENLFKSLTETLWHWILWWRYHTGIEHYFAVFVDDQNFIPNNKQIRVILNLFQQHGIVEHGFLQTTKGQAILSILDKNDQENGVVLEISIPVSYWSPMLKDLNPLSENIENIDPESQMTIFGEPTPINSEIEESPLTRFILLDQCFGRGDLFDELELLRSRFFEINKLLVKDIEACISKPLGSGIIYA